MRLAGVLGAFFAVVVSHSTASGQVYSVPVGTSPFRGPAHAPVTMIMGCQYFGPYCARVRPTLDALLQRYGNNLKIVHKHYRVHRNRATPAAMAACAAHRQGLFFEMDEAIWTRAYPQRAHDAAEMELLAKSIGLDLVQYRTDIQHTCPAVVAADESLLQSRGLRGTPGFFINGKYLSGARPLASFTAVIDAELALAKKRIAAGTPLKRYYDTYVVRRGLTQVASPPRRASRPTPSPSTVYSVPVGTSPSLGPRNAKVTMVVSVDFSSPFSKRLRPILDALRQKYGADLRIVFKHFVVYPTRSTEPALAACAAHRQGRFLDMEQAIWGMPAGGRDANALAKAAERLQLRMRKYQRDVARICPKVIAADKALLARVGARGVPASFINGRHLSGARPIQQFEQLIDEELRKANRRIRRGAAKKRTYYRKWVVRRGKRSI